EYEWTASTGQFAYGKRATLTFEQAGTHSITLKVTATNGLTDTTIVSVKVNEPPPPPTDDKYEVVASATVFPQEGMAPLPVTLNASGRKPYGKIKEYNWSSTDGQVASGKLTQMTFQQPGAYILTLRVTAENGLDSTAQQTVVVKETPPPVAVATASPSEGVAPINVNLQGNKSEGDIEEYEWTINGQTFYGRRTSFLFEEAGEYNITLTVTDKKGRSSTAETKVTVKAKKPDGPVVGDEPPVAVAKASPNDGFAPLNVTLDAADSTGKLIEYSWATPQGILYGRKVSVFLEAGSHPITLTITDQNGLTAMASTVVVVKKQPEPDEPPVAVAEILPTEGVAPLKLVLDGSNSQGKIDEYLWKSTSGDIAKGQLTNMWIENPGTHTISLKVKGASGSHEVTTTVLVKPEPVTPPPPAPPVNVVNEEDTKGEGLTVGKKITLNAGDNPDIIEYKWTTSDGKVFYGQKPTLSFKEPGDYSVNLTVTDKHGLSTTTPNFARVNVPPPAAPPVVPPIAEPIEQPFTNSEGKPGKQVRFSADDDPNIVEYKWQASNGEVAYGKQPLFSFDTPGEHTIDLTVKDKNGQTTTAKKVATVTVPRKDDGGSGGSDKPLDIEKVKVSPSEDDSESVLELDASELGDIEDKYVKWEAINDKGEIIAQSVGKETTLSLPPGTGAYRIQMRVEEEGGVIRAQSVVATATTEKGREIEVTTTDGGGSGGTELKADADADRYKICPNNRVTLNGKGSTGEIDVYKWEIETSGRVLANVLYGETTHLLLEQPGVYTISLKVFGKEGDSDEDSITITVDNCDILACYDASLMASSDDEPEKLDSQNKITGNQLTEHSMKGNLAQNWSLYAELEATCSEGDIAEFHWKLNGKPVDFGQEASIALKTKGTHIITLEVQDKDGLSDEARAEINLGELIAKAQVEPTITALGATEEEAIQLDSSTSEFGVYSVSEEFKYNWSVEPDSKNKRGCDQIDCFLAGSTKPQAKMSCKGKAPDDTMSCRYTPILELTDPKKVTSTTNYEYSSTVTITWAPIARINIREPNVVTDPYSKKVGLVKVKNMTEKVYYGDSPMTLKLDSSQSKSASKEDKVSLEDSQWTISCEEVNDFGDIVKKKPVKKSGEVIEFSLNEPGNCEIRLTVVDEKGLESEQPDMIKLIVGPMLKFVLLDGEQSTEGPDRLIAHKKLGETLNLGLKIYFNPALIEHCHFKNDAGEYDRFLDMYGAILIPANVVRILLQDDKAVEMESVMWFSEITNVDLQRLGLLPIEAKKPFQPFRTSFDFQQHYFGLMNVTLEDKGWVGAHFFGFAAGIFGKDLKNMTVAEDDQVCINPYLTKGESKDLVIIKLVELQVTE
ncbi:MAG: PKD domain-containing protein, partial [Candidatus Parabeggiatoa sp.]|nr:PKD domain-containing protein [Candidatus Parabeggiatoa sp.]